MSITTEYPLYLIIFCLIFGAICARVLYRKKSVDFSKPLKIALAFFRFSVITLLSFFLLNPLLKTIFREVEKPLIVIAQDNSESLIAGKDSAFYREEYKTKINALINDLSEKYEVKAFSFGEKISENISFDFNEKQTDISEMLDEIHTRYSNRNIGAVILASDGIFNKGANPFYISSKLKSPVYTIALGDTSIKKDLILKNVLYNRIAYLGNKFPVEVIISANELSGKNTQLKISKNDEIVFTQPVEITSQSFNISIPVQIEAKQKGIQKYKIHLSNLENEASYANNIFEIYVDVIDGKQKILVIANSPHPDIRALRETIENSDNYEVDVKLANEIKIAETKSYNLIILHQIPSLKNPVVNLIQAISQEKIPLLFILGSETEWNGFNNQQTGLNISGGRGKMNESQPLIAQKFSLFTLSDELKTYAKNFPPMQTPFGNYKISPSVNILFYQKIGMVETQQPLVFFNSFSEKKVGVIAGEGLWRWRLNDFVQHGNQNIFNEFTLKTVQYLALKENKNRFRISGKNIFMENEQIVFDAELYNESYELINEPEINFEIINEEEKKFPFAFGRIEKAYHLNAGIFPTGNYKYETLTKIGENILSTKGEFSVSPVQVEKINSVADHQLLFSIAKKSGGEMLYPSQIPEISKIIDERKDITSVSYTHTNLSDFINVKWIFFLLFFLLSAEWFIRKRNGSY